MDYHASYGKRCSRLQPIFYGYDFYHNPCLLASYANIMPGRHSCPGKQLGLLEIRMVAVMIALAPVDKNQSRVVRDTVDAFVAIPGDLELVFEPVYCSFACR